MRGEVYHHPKSQELHEQLLRAIAEVDREGTGLTGRGNAEQQLRVLRAKIELQTLEQAFKSTQIQKWHAERIGELVKALESAVSEVRASGERHAQTVDTLREAVSEMRESSRSQVSLARYTFAIAVGTSIAAVAALVQMMIMTFRGD